MAASRTGRRDISACKPSQAWQVQTTDTIYSNGFFTLRRDKCFNGLDPADARELFVLEIPDRVSVVPVTEEGRFILIEQYRHGVADWILECPGGTVDDDDIDPSTAAARELLEETGYVPASLISLGSNAADPSGQASQIHSYLAVGCTFVSKPADPCASRQPRAAVKPDSQRCKFSGGEPRLIDVGARTITRGHRLNNLTFFDNRRSLWKSAHFICLHWAVLKTSNKGWRGNGRICIK